MEETGGTILYGCYINTLMHDVFMICFFLYIFKVKKIQPSSYAEFQNHQFGKQLVTSLQLCSMFKRKDKAGYYHVDYVSQLHCKFLYGKTEIVLQQI